MVREKVCFEEVRWGLGASEGEKYLFHETVWLELVAVGEATHQGSLTLLIDVGETRL